MLSASVWNANDKYESAKMEEKVEIEPFDETKTPASVPPRFAENKMKKHLGKSQILVTMNLVIYKYKR